MRNTDYDRAAVLLDSHGFVFLKGGHKAGVNMWHHPEGAHI